MKIAITGSSGMIGRALVPSLRADGHTVIRIVRHSTVRDDDIIPWNPPHGQLDAASLEGIDAVIHLAGSNLASGRWTARSKKLMYTSRVDSALLLCQRLASLSRPPAIYISASGIGFYGDRGEEQLTEQSSAGSGYLAELCVAWEKAADELAARGTRTAFLRLGMVLSNDGGALDKMLLPFRFGLGGRLGHGHQVWSWISMPDVLGVVIHLLQDNNLAGPINAVSPHPVTNREFTKTLASVLHRPAIFPVPAFMLRLRFGQMADETIFASTCVLPEKLLKASYSFQQPELKPALEQILS